MRPEELTVDFLNRARRERNLPTTPAAISIPKEELVIQEAVLSYCSLLLEMGLSRGTEIQYGNDCVLIFTHNKGSIRGECFPNVADLVSLMKVYDTPGEVILCSDFEKMQNFNAVGLTRSSEE